MELEANPFKYKALILDARCIWDENGEFPNDKFLSRVVAELERLERKLNTYYPAVVNTAYVDDFKEERELIRNRGGDIFLKSSGNTEDESKIFHFVKGRIEDLEEWTYRDVFSLFQGDYFDVGLRQDLIRILKRLSETSGVKDNFNPLRTVLEAVVRKIKDTDSALLPDEVFIHEFNRGINLEWCWKYLSGLPVYRRGERNPVVEPAPQLLPPHVSACMKLVKENSTKISHEYSEEVYPYAYKTSVFALMEVLMWLRDFLNSRGA